MKRKIYFVALCTVILTVAMGPSVQAEDFGWADIEIMPNLVNTVTTMYSPPGMPDWDWNGGYVMNWSVAQYGPQLIIECFVAIHETCDQQNTMDYKFEVHVNVWDNVLNQNVGDAFLRNANWPGTDTSNSQGDTHTGTPAIVINNPAIGDKYQVTIDADIWDCNQIPPWHWNHGSTGEVIVV